MHEIPIFQVQHFHESFSVTVKFYGNKGKGVGQVLSKQWE